MGTRKKEENKPVFYFIAAMLAAAVAGSVYFGYRHRIEAPKRLEAHARTWFESPRIMSRVLMERYGPPSVLAPEVATWYEREPWKRITVHGDAPENYLEQTVGYRTRPSAVAPLRKFGQGIRIDLIKEELSARSNTEALNFLALNLANEVAAGRRSPKEARDFYLRTEKLAAAGKSSPYTERLLFEPYRFVPQERSINTLGY